MKEIKLEKGITLVALIITIIILLILAVVAIGAVNNTGIVKYAQNSAEKYDDGRDEEKQGLQNYVDILDYYNPNKEAEWATTGQGDLYYIGNGPKIDLSTSSKIKVETIKDIDMGENGLIYTRTGEVQEVDISNFLMIACSYGQGREKLEYVDFGNHFAEGTIVTFSWSTLVCSNLKEIKGIAGVTSIDGGYDDLINLESLTIPSTITDMTDSSFENCEKFTRLIIEQADSSVLGEEWIPDTVTDIQYVGVKTYE